MIGIDKKWARTWAWAFRHLSQDDAHDPYLSGPTIVYCSYLWYKLCNVYSTRPFPSDFSPSAHQNPRNNAL